MEMEERAELEQYYLERSDEEIKQFLLSGRDSFQEGAYEMIVAEARRRRIDEKALLAEQSAQKSLHEMTRGELLRLLSADEPPHGLHIDSLYAEAFRRNIQRDEIAEYRLNSSAGNTDRPMETERPAALECTFPLLSFDRLDGVKSCADALDRARIPFVLQILVNEQDYAKAENETNTVIFKDPSSKFKEQE